MKNLPNHQPVPSGHFNVAMENYPFIDDFPS